MDSYYVAKVADAIGDPTRIRMLNLLLDGRAHTAGECCRAAGTSPSTTSAHLAKMVDAQLITRIKSGRQQYYHLASHAVAEALESLAQLKPPTFEHAHVPKAARHLMAARSCYDHIAGRLGVALAEGLIRQAYIEQRDANFVLTPAGEIFANKLGIQTDRLRAMKRPLVRACLDWSERRYHVAGSLGAALMTAFLDQGWIKRGHKSRALLVTPKGERMLRSELISTRAVPNLDTR